MISDVGTGGGEAASILLVDDRKENLDVLELILQELGRPIVRAGSGPDALRKLLERDFAVVLLDVRMPEMDGYETAALIRGRQRSRHTPIIFLTAFDTDREELRRAYSIGAADFIFKPIVPEILRSKVSVFVDLKEKTDLVQRQLEELRRGEERFRALAETANDAIVSADGAGNIIYTNRAAERIFGYASGDLAGQPLTRLMPERYRNAHEEGLARYLRGGGARLLGGTVELAGRRRDGTEFPMEISLATWKAGQEHFFTGILRDVSERKRAEQERERMNAQLLQGQKLQALGQLAAGVAHEINNPTSYILSNFGTLEEYVGDLERYLGAVEGALSDEARQKLRALRDELKIEALLADARSALVDSRHGAERIRDIVRTLREYTHPDERDFAPVDLQAVVESAARLCGSELKHRIQLKLEFEALPPVLGHVQQLEQVFVNLLVNASHAIEGKGQVDIVARREGDHAVVRLRDSGSGISPAHLPKLFEPFFTTKPVGQGTGLGLYLVHRIVTGHGGRIDVTSHPDQGTEFTVRLPVQGPEGGTSHAPPSMPGRVEERGPGTEAPGDPGRR